ncbi:MAG: GNAT family N-acetyltransferase [Pseudomonadales bacterium]
MVRYQTHLDGTDWEALRRDLIADDFHNGRTTMQLRRSFENSQHVALGFDGNRCIATGRMLSDGVGNAYVIDVWTLSAFRNRGVATEIMRLLTDVVPGQHVYLQTDDAVGFYTRLGFRPQPEGLSIIVGRYLDNDTRG